MFAAYGLPGRSTLGAVRQLRAEGHKVGVIRPITAWPFPENAFKKINPQVKGLITVEANATGQLVDDVALYTKKALENNVPVYAMTYVYDVPAMKSIKADYHRVVSGEATRRY